jgi:hypothetical protein
VLDFVAGTTQLGGQPIGQDRIVFGEQHLHAPKLNKLMKR